MLSVAASEPQRSCRVQSAAKRLVLQSPDIDVTFGVEALDFNNLIERRSTDKTSVQKRV